MIPATAATQNTRREAMSRSYSGFGDASLADDEGDPGDDRDGEQDEGQAPLVRDRREVDAEDQRADQHGRQDPAQVVDRLGRLVDVRRHEPDGHDQRDDRQRQGDQEDRSPVESLEEEPGDERAERAIAPPSADQRAIDRVRPGPDHSAVMSASVVG